MDGSQGDEASPHEAVMPARRRPAFRSGAVADRAGLWPGSDQELLDRNFTQRHAQRRGPWSAEDGLETPLCHGPQFGRAAQPRFPPLSSREALYFCDLHALHGGDQAIALQGEIVSPKGSAVHNQLLGKIVDGHRP